MRSDWLMAFKTNLYDAIRVCDHATVAKVYTTPCLKVINELCVAGKQDNLGVDRCGDLQGKCLHLVICHRLEKKKGVFFILFRKVSNSWLNLLT